MRALVTGGAGFVGSNLALALQDRGWDVVIVDNFSSGDSRNLKGFKGEVYTGDILEFDIWRLMGIDVIFHQAAITDTTLLDRDLMTRVNVDGTKRLLEYAVRERIPFIYASSASVYGNAPSPQKEKDAGNPVNLYGLSKWMADCLATRYMKKADSLIVGLRYFNVFGPGESYKGKMASMVWKLANQIKSGNSPRIFKWGEQARDQVYIKDVVRANILALGARESGIVNVGSGNATTFNHIVETLNKLLGGRKETDYFDNPYAGCYQEHTQADLGLARKLIGYEPAWSFEDAVEDYLKEVRFIR
ncbi:ADP-glyceromanno-heptose 6-epimerase [bacterium]|nr:ADP-glyceromanno-heptose 6-epimerase [bacterium]